MSDNSSSYNNFDKDQNVEVIKSIANSNDLNLIHDRYKHFDCSIKPRADIGYQLPNKRSEISYK